MYKTKLGQIGEYWLSQRSGSPAWYRTWTEGNRSKRASLGTSDFEQAKQRLIDWYVSNREVQNEDLSLAEVIARYWEGHGQNLVTARDCRDRLNYWLDWWGETLVSEITPHKVGQFQDWLLAKGQKPNTVNRVVADGRSALNRAFKRGEISAVPYLSKLKVESVPAKGAPMTVQQMKDAYEKAPAHIQKLFIILAGTACRPGAALDLTYEQFDYEHGLIDLNPPGRVQNKKYRPVVKMPQALVLGGGEGVVVTYRGKPVKCPKKAVRAVLPKGCTLYSFRHTAARFMRAQGVPAWEVAAQLGHKVAGTTEIYAPFDPAYLSNAQKALDKLVRQMCASDRIQQSSQLVESEVITG